MMKEVGNCDICYPKQAKECASPVRKKKELAKSPERSINTCNFSSQYDAGRDTRRRHRRQYEVKQVTCEKCRYPPASSSDDMNSVKARFWRRARKPETEDKSIGYSWSKRSFINMRNFLHRPCKWCKDFKDTSSQCGSKKDGENASIKKIPPIQTRTLTVMTEKKVTRDKSALMNLPTIKEDCAVQTRTKGLTKPARLKNYGNNDSPVGPSHVGDNANHRERPKKPTRPRKQPANNAAVEQANIGDNAVVDLYSKDNQSSDDTDEKNQKRKRDAKIANRRCGIWNIQFLTHAKNYPAIRLEISPRQTQNRLGDAVPKISRETAKENIISWFDYKTHSKSTLRSKKHEIPEKHAASPLARGVRNFIINRCAVSESGITDNSIITETSASNKEKSNHTSVTPSEYIYDIQIQNSDELVKEENNNLYKSGNTFQTKLEVYQLFAKHYAESLSTTNQEVEASESSAEELDSDTQTLYNSLVLRKSDKVESDVNCTGIYESGKSDIARNLINDLIRNTDTISNVSNYDTLESNTYVVTSASEDLNDVDVLQSEDLKKAVLNLYTASELTCTDYDHVARFPHLSSEKRIIKSIKKKLQ